MTVNELAEKLTSQKYIQLYDMYMASHSIDQAIQSNSPYIRAIAIKDCQKHHLDILMNDDSEIVRASIALQGTITRVKKMREDESNLVRHVVIKRLLYRISTSELKTFLKQHLHDIQSNENIILEIINRSVGPQLLKQLWNSGNFNIRVKLISRYKSRFLDIAINDDDPRIVAKAIKIGKRPSDIEFMLSSKNPTIRSAIASVCNNTILNMMVQDKNAAVQLASINNPNINSMQLLELSKSEFDTVRWCVNEALSIEKLKDGDL